MLKFLKYRWRGFDWDVDCLFEHLKLQLLLHLSTIMFFWTLVGGNEV